MDAGRTASQTIEAAVIIRRPVDTVFRFCQDFRNLPRFVGDIIHVELTGERSFWWTIRTPFGFDVRWPVSVTEIRANALITYEMQSLLAPIRWSLAFSSTDGGAATVVQKRVTIPGGKIAAIVFSALGKPPACEVHLCLARLAELLETGRVTPMDYVVDGHRLAMQPSVTPSNDGTNVSCILPEQGIKMAIQGTARIGRDHYHTQIDMSGHSLVADEPLDKGGRNEGPSPFDLVLSGLGACTAITLRMYADRKQWPLESLDVGVRLRRADDGTLHIERTLTPVGIEADQCARLAEVAEKTPVTLTLKHGLPIETRVVLT